MAAYLTRMAMVGSIPDLNQDEIASQAAQVGRVLNESAEALGLANDERAPMMSDAADAVRADVAAFVEGAEQMQEYSEALLLNGFPGGAANDAFVRTCDATSRAASKMRYDLDDIGTTVTSQPDAVDSDSIIGNASRHLHDMLGGIFEAIDRLNDSCAVLVREFAA